MSYLNFRALTHAQRIRGFYKRCLKCVRDHNPKPDQFLYQSAILRARFDENRNIKDYMQAEKIYRAGEKELFSYMHPQPRPFFWSPGGTGYGRRIKFSDAMLDTWHPFEKAQYPEYFARREIRKREYIENWEKKYGKPKEIIN